MHAEIVQRFTCAHEKRQLRLRIIGDGRPAYYRQCIRCGHAGQAVSRKTALSEAKGGNIPAFDDDAASRWDKAKTDEYMKVAYAIDQEFRLIYEDYLLSPQWKSKKEQVFNRSGGKCEVCEINEATTAHHLTYEHLCCEPLDELMAVCDFCHDVLHGKIKL